MCAKSSSPVREHYLVDILRVLWRVHPFWNLNFKFSRSCDPQITPGSVVMLLFRKLRFVSTSKQLVEVPNAAVFWDLFLSF